MRRGLPLLLLLAAALAGVGLLLFGGGGIGGSGGALDRPDDDWEEAKLKGIDLRADPRSRPPTPPEGQGPGTPADASPPDVPGRVLTGRVLDARDDAPLAAARVWLEPHRDPCPRFPDIPDPTGPEGDPGFPRVTDAEGRFRLVLRDDPPAAGVDLFVFAPKHAGTVLCATPVPGDVTVRLEPALSIKGRIVDPDRQPVAGASVEARPAPETPAVPGHGTTLALAPVQSDEKGRFELDGFLPGLVLVEADHPRYMPKTSDPVDPAAGAEVEIRLVPALIATFRIRTDDGRTPEHPTLVWTTTDVKPRSEVVLLPTLPTLPGSVIPDFDSARRAPATPEGARAPAEEPGLTVCGPVRLPCDARSVVLDVKADGYATWRSEPLRFPREGGEETFEVTLVGDLSTGSVRIALEDADRQAVSVVASNPTVLVAKLDPGTPSSAYVLEQREDLRVTALPAGRYRFEIAGAAFAPALVDVTVVAGQETESVVRVRPPAKVKVKIVGSTDRLVRFEVQRDGRRVPDFPEGSFERRTDPETGEAVVVAGPDGLLLSGFASGTYAVVVTDEQMAAAPTTVRLAEGETVEVEVLVRPR